MEYGIYFETLFSLCQLCGRTNEHADDCPLMKLIDKDSDDAGQDESD